jgi:hypothetical protein
MNAKTVTTNEKCQVLVSKSAIMESVSVSPNNLIYKSSLGRQPSLVKLL